MVPSNSAAKIQTRRDAEHTVARVWTSTPRVGFRRKPQLRITGNLSCYGQAEGPKSAPTAQNPTHHGKFCPKTTILDKSRFAERGSRRCR